MSVQGDGWGAATGARVPSEAHDEQPQTVVKQFELHVKKFVHYLIDLAIVSVIVTI